MKIFIGLACLAVVTSAGFVSKKYSFKELSVPKSKCGLQEVVCPTYPICCPLSHPLCCGEKCCRANQPYCCPDGIYCAETAEDCPSKKTPNLLRKKALPKKLPFVKTPLGSKGPECPTECGGGRCCPANWYCCPDNRWCAWTLADC